jgi:hypothetical protein
LHLFATAKSPFLMRLFGVGLGDGLVRCVNGFNAAMPPSLSFGIVLDVLQLVLVNHGHVPVS